MRIKLLIFSLLFFGYTNAQERVPRIIDTTTIFHDVFKGAIQKSGNNVAIELQLNHKQYYDMGSFELTYICKGTTRPNVIMSTKGEWTVLKGDAKDDNATVVELDVPKEVQYYLRRKDGSLQKLDSSLHEIIPAQILRKPAKAKQ